MCVRVCDMYILSSDTGCSPLKPKGLFRVDFYVVTSIDLQSGWVPVRAWHLFERPPVLKQGRHASWLPNSPQSGHRATAAVAATTRVNYFLS